VSSNLVGLGTSAIYCYFFLSAPSRLIGLHNRIMGTSVAMAVVYASFFDMDSSH
jgi:hypothetical protein